MQEEEPGQGEGSGVSEPPRHLRPDHGSNPGELVGTQGQPEAAHLERVELFVVQGPVAVTVAEKEGATDFGNNWLGVTKLGNIISGTTWFIAMDLLTLILLIAFPALSLYLPALMAG